MEILVLLLSVVYALVVIVIALAGLRGLHLFKDLTEGVPRSTPVVSIIIPVKNEADTLQESLESVAALDYPSKEVIVVCASSTDETERIVRGFRENVRVITEPPSPEGWVGKCWACYQGSLVASGELLLFTDGDVIHTKKSLRSSIARLRDGELDMLSVWPRTVSRARSERTVYPVGVFFLAAGIAAFGTVETGSGKVIKGANGQYILVTREAYFRLGGHAAVREEIIEDGALGRLAVESGLRVENLDGRQLLSVKPYRNFGEVWLAFERFSAGLIPSAGLLLATVIASLLFFTVPILLLAAGLLLGSVDGTGAGASASIVSLVTMSRFYSGYSHTRYVLLTPAAGLVLVAAFVKGFIIFRRSGVEWKGLTYKSRAKTAADDTKVRPDDRP